MNIFAKNNCRYCKKVFCCINCRIEHEKNAHDFNASCNFCNFKWINIDDNLSDKLKNHINEIHTPFKCPHCCTILIRYDNFIAHLKYTCTILKDKITSNNSNCITPLATKNNNIEKFVNKPDTNLKTSTPRNDNDYKDLEELQDKITPVTNTISSFKHLNKESCLKCTPPFNGDTKNTDFSIKRRVTFSDTIKDIKEYYVDKGDEDSIDDFKVPVICIDDSNVSQEKSVEVNDTVWHTAIETSQENINEINSSSVGTFDTDLTTESTSNQYASSSSDNKQSSLDIWSSMTNVFKNIVDSFSMSNENIITGERKNKRYRSDKDDIFETRPHVKRRKYLNVECRKTIRPLAEKYFQFTKKITCDKSTQTD